MVNFADRLLQKIDETGNPTVMGLDPMLDYIPESILKEARAAAADPADAAGQAILTFNCRLIDAVVDLIPAVKPQFAYYEQYGAAGYLALQQTIAYAKARGMIVIADAKRNDIGSTAEAYARAILGQTSLGRDESGQTIARSFLGADAVTLNGYLGSDGIQPFLKQLQPDGQGVFVLVRTSNPSAGDLQDQLLTDGRTVYEAMAGLVAEWGEPYRGESGYSAVGAVVGATWPRQAVKLRTLLPHSLILVPGYGAQGATADDAVASFDQKGQGALVNASRSLMLAWRKYNRPIEEFAAAARQEAMVMRDELQEALRRSGRNVR